MRNCWLLASLLAAASTASMALSVAVVGLLLLRLLLGDVDGRASRFK